MKIADFGRFEGPLVLFGGAYSNLHALQAFAERIGDMPAIGTGDAVAYCANPNESIALIRSRGWPCIAGNCEVQIVEGAQDCGCGFDDGSSCDLLSRGWYPFLLRSATSDTIEWMGQLPEIGVFVHGNRRYAVIHGGATVINRFLWPSTDDSDFEIKSLEKLVGRIDGVVAGHCGLAFHRKIGIHHWINAGAIGLPPHDGRHQTRYAVLIDGEVKFERLSYDQASARKAMETVGLDQGYHETLETGFWPSEDILPQSLRR